MLEANPAGAATASEIGTAQASAPALVTAGTNDDIINPRWRGTSGASGAYAV